MLCKRGNHGKMYPDSHSYQGQTVRFLRCLICGHVEEPGFEPVRECRDYSDKGRVTGSPSVKKCSDADLFGCEIEHLIERYDCAADTIRQERVFRKRRRRNGTFGKWEKYAEAEAGIGQPTG